jgi:S-adenosylmethionine:tRNA ribosyltransferase-isomerase
MSPEPSPLSLSDFDFPLPPERIALRPAVPRSAARLLAVGVEAGFQDLTVADLPGLLRPGDVLVFNDTRVIPARLFGVRVRDGSSVKVEATLNRRIDPARWSAFMRPGKRLRLGDRVGFHAQAGGEPTLFATIEGKDEGGEVRLAFDPAGPALDDAVREIGLMPLPPYIAAKRAEDAQDLTDYQTVYARADGSVAAPTAGLHFTPEILAELTARGVGQAFVTLHVGAGTFLPVKTEQVEDHHMHAEYGEVTAQTAAALNAARAAGGRIVAVGTTSLRLLESATGEDGVVRPFADETSIFIRPGYRFRCIDALMTNFHLPRSTLIMLVAALAGLDRVKAAYAHAIETGYRFYSYGDSSFWLRADSVGEAG